MSERRVILVDNGGILIATPAAWDAASDRTLDKLNGALDPSGMDVPSEDYVEPWEEKRKEWMDTLEAKWLPGRGIVLVTGEGEFHVELREATEEEAALAKLHLELPLRCFEGRVGFGDAQRIYDDTDDDHTIKVPAGEVVASIWWLGRTQALGVYGSDEEPALLMHFERGHCEEGKRIHDLEEALVLRWPEVGSVVDARVMTTEEGRTQLQLMLGPFTPCGRAWLDEEAPRGEKVRVRLEKLEGHTWQVSRIS